MCIRDSTDTKSRSTGTTASERNIYDQTLKAGLDVNWTLFDGFNISTTYKKLDVYKRQIDTLKKAVKEGMPEDEQKNAEAKLPKVHDKYIAKIEELLAEKDKEIMTV